MRQQHQALGSIKSTNPSQSNPLTPTLIPTPFSISKPFPISHSPSPNSTASSSLRTLMDSTLPKPEWDAMDSAKNQQTKCKRKGRKEKKEKKRRRRRALNVLEFGGMAWKKKEERRIKKKRVRVRVCRRKKEEKK